MIRTTMFSMFNSDRPQELEGEIEEHKCADSNGQERDVRHAGPPGLC